MPEINVHGGSIALIDDIDADLAQLRWCIQSGYVGRATYTSEGGRYGILIHRAILARMLGRELEKGELTDHINGDKLDNRRCNLRLATPSQNQHNRGGWKKSATGFKGVSFHKRRGRWTAQIGHKNHLHHLGYFDTPIDAAIAYNAAAIKYHGDFARLNDIPSHQHPNTYQEAHNATPETA